MFTRHQTLFNVQKYENIQLERGNERKQKEKKVMDEGLGC